MQSCFHSWCGCFVIVMIQTTLENKGHGKINKKKKWNMQSESQLPGCSVHKPCHICIQLYPVFFLPKFKSICAEFIVNFKPQPQTCNHNWAVLCQDFTHDLCCKKKTQYLPKLQSSKQVNVVSPVLSYCVITCAVFTFTYRSVISWTRCTQR